MRQSSRWARTLTSSPGQPCDDQLDGFDHDAGGDDRDDFYEAEHDGVIIWVRTLTMVLTSSPGQPCDDCRDGFDEDDHDV